MKKLINLIALVMLVSTNVLTPFSYAQEEIPEVIPENEVGNVEEIGEILEKDNEITGEIPNSLGEVEGEGSLPLVREVVNETSPAKQGENLEGLKEEVKDSLDDVKTPAPDEDKKEDTEKGESDEVVQSEEENAENEKQEENLEGDELEEELGLQKIDEPTIMEEEPGTSVTLLPGQEFNSVIKTLANGGTEVAYTEVDDNIQSFQRVDVEPTGVTTGEISIAGSEYPVHAWFSGGVLYYSTKAEIVQMNENSQNMFQNFSGLTGLDLSSWDISNVTNMSRMFSGCANIEDLILDNWDFSNNPNIGGMFLGLSSLKTLSARNWIIPETFNSAFGCTNAMLCAENITIDVSNWDLSETNSLKELFYHSYAKEIKGLDTWDTSNVTDMNGMFRYANKVTKLDISNWDTSNVTDMAYLFYECWSLVELDVSNWDISKVTTMYYMFRDCHEIVEMDLSKWDTRNLTDVGSMFMACYKLKKLRLDNWDTSKVTSIGQIFNSCNKLEELSMSGWDFRNIDASNLFVSKMSSGRWSALKKLNMTNTKFSGSMSYAFHGISGIEEIRFDGIDTSNVTGMQSMFDGCKNLVSLDLSSFDTSNVVNMDSMFRDCTGLVNLNLSGWDFRNVGSHGLINKISLWSSPLKTLNMANAKFSGSMQRAFQGLSNKNEINLNLDNIDTSNVTSMNLMFQDCKGLTGLNVSGWDTSNVTNMSQMFYGCSGLQNLDLSSLDTSKVSNMSTMFYGCSSLTSLDLSNWDTNSLKNVEAMFYGCSNLTGLNLSNWNTSNVNDMRSMFTNCNKLENLNLSGWDFRNISNSSLMHNIRNIYDSNNNYPSLKYLNMTNTKFSGSMESAFNGLTSLQEIDLEGADTSNVISMNQMFQSCSNLTGLNLSGWNIRGVADLRSMFNGCSKLENLNLNGWDLSNNPNMGSMFYGASNLKTVSFKNWTIPENFQDAIGCRTSQLCASTIENIDVSNWNLNSTKNLYGLFGNSKVKEIKGLDTRDTSGIQNINQMFQYCSNLTGLDLSNWETRNITGMSATFQGCSSLEKLNLNGWDLSNNPNMGNFISTNQSLKMISMSGWTIPENFQDKIGRNWGYINNSLEEIDVSNWDLSQTKNIQGLFADTKKLKTIKGLDTWDTSGIENMYQMFQNCNNLTELNLSSFDTSNVINMGYMFQYCGGLQELNLSSFDTSSVTDMSSMFYGCTSLAGLDLSNFDTNNVSDMNAIFGGCNHLEELNLSGWDFRNAGPNMRTMMAGGNSSIKILDITNAKYGTNMYQAFAGLSNLEKIKGLDTLDTSDVVNMDVLFYGCSSLTGLDLSSWNTSNVTNMGSMFGGCSKLEEINLSGWDFGNVNNASLMMNMTAGGIPALTKLNVTNTKYTGNATYAFGGLDKLEELNLNGADTRGVINMTAMFNGDSKLKDLDLSSFDTSNVTNMPQMFYNCSSLDELDLSNFNTSKVEIMGQMFYNTPNLKTIYASNKFVTTALSGDNSSKDMFSGTISVVGGNGTKFDSNYIDEEYAKIDKVGQTGYFTDKNAINIKFVNTLDGTETLATFAKGQNLTPPAVNGYHAVGGYLDEAMTQEIDLNKGVDSYSEIYVKYDHNGSSGGGGGGGSSKKTDEDTHGSAEDSQKNTQDDKNTENVIQNETKGSEESSNTPMDSSDKSSEGQEILSPSNSSFTKEQKDAYTFAKENGITTKDTIQSAQMNGKLTRIAMAKMLSQYAINVLGQTPDTSKTIKFKDVSNKKDADYDNGVTLAYQLGIMGQNMPGNKFRPNDEVSRAEFATALSRLLYQTTDGKYKSTKEYYIPHMAKLYNEGIISNTDPSMSERRGYVMIMLMRSAK